METGVWVAAGGATVLVGLVAAFFLRLRLLAGRTGSFECALRMPGERRWTSGIATLTEDAMEWSRLISLRPRPRYRISRDDIELGQMRHRAGGGPVIEVECRYRGHRVELAMVEDSHSAVVAWLESAAPTQPRLF